MKTNYKGFGLTYSLDKHGNVIIERVEGSLTNQIALLTSALCEDDSRVGLLTIELGYSYFDVSDYVDLAIDIDNWIKLNPDMQQHILIELLTLETAEIEEQIGEVV